MPVKIGMVTEYYFPLLGGMTEHVYNLSKRLARNGFEVKVITSHVDGPSGNLSRDPAGTEIIRVGKGIPLFINGSVARIAAGFRLREKLRAILAEERFDLLHIHSPTVFTLPVFSLFEAKCATIGTYHTYFDRSFLYAALKGIIQKHAVNKLDGQIAVSRSTIDAMRRYFTLNPRIIPNGVDVEVFHPRVEPLEKYRDGKKNLLFMGRFDPRNGLEFMLRAFAEIKSRYPEVRLIVVGDGPFAGYYRRLVPRSLRCDIHFEGMVWEERPRYYATCDVFCSPVTKASFGVTLLEAMASGRPIVATENAGYREVLSDREGYMLEQGDVRAFASAVTGLLGNDRLRTKLGENGRAKSLLYSWDQITGEITEYYAEVLNWRVCRTRMAQAGVPLLRNLSQEIGTV